MKVELECLLGLIMSSLERMPQDYFRITTTYEPLGIVRERAFCYELYHQMRWLQEHQGIMGISLHGEIDKSGHDLFSRDAQKNPDFIFHVPGTMESNNIVIEVKGNIEGQYREGVFKDIQTLSKFTDKQHKYHLGVFIIYNYSLEEFKQCISGRIKQRVKNKNILVDHIIVLCKKNQNDPMESGSLSSLLNEVS
jgi:hypothetical protein